MISVLLTKDKVTKRTLRFAEDIKDDEDKILGQIYVPKKTLNEIGYKEGDKLEVTLSVKKGEE
mgnify:CR=1 FL=1